MGTIILSTVPEGKIKRLGRHQDKTKTTKPPATCRQKISTDMNKNIAKTTVTALMLAMYTSIGAQTPAELVNPFIGASTNTEKAGAYHGLGKTFPGAATPYGLTQVSPQTITGGDNGSGYSDEHTTIEGFSMTQMSGIGWNGDLGNFTVMPSTGSKMYTVAGREDGSIKGWRSRYDKQSEKAHAGYYAVRFADSGIGAELTASPHGGVMRFTFPKSDTSRLQIDLARRVGGTADMEQVKIVDSHTIEGWMRCTPDGGGWGNGEGHSRYTVYFHATFSKPLDNCGFWQAAIPDTAQRKIENVTADYYLQNVARAKVMRDPHQRELTGRHIGFFTEFATTAGEAVEMKIGISFVDMEGARRNYRAELDGQSFDNVKTRAEALWNKALSCMEIEGGTHDQKVIFYTSLYHTMIDPRVYTDVDGRYVGGDYEVHSADKSFTKRTMFSGWDVFRSQFPLQTIINPSLVRDMIASLLTMATESGRHYYERWELLNSYSGCMLGNPAVSVIADAWAKGIREYDGELALEYAINSSKRFGNDALGYTPGSLGVSHTLEYAYTDWCTARLAAMLGKTDIEQQFIKKSQAWRNIWSDEMKWFRPRNADGTWMEIPKDGRLTEWYGAMEANSLQQGWFVPHDIDGMADIMGGRKKAIADLEWMFANTPKDYRWNLYYNHANEPVHFIPYLFNRLGKPKLTQKWTRDILDNAYQNRVEGLCGNEDVGQMSAWYVLTAAGMHQACPGDTRFEITSPLFDKLTIHLDPAYAKGSTFVIKTIGNSPKNVYIKRMRLNGRPYDKTYIDYSDIMAGGTLEMEMAAK